ncbi:hypothetical protein ACFVT5_06145 [Streptomyces sp. NPDC058001]|uniref:hypothetical protein n=1 Tax=Streptomyces sp. NPDC058001 TaxID=3346300 RepID=UPI0036EF93A6
MRIARQLTGPALAVAAVGLATAPAVAGDARGVEVLPASAAPGTVATVNTRACGAGSSATGDASAVGSGQFTLAPTTLDDTTIGQFKVPASAQMGTYEIVVKCSDGKRAAGDLTVTPAAAQGQPYPRGHVDSGVGGALGPDPVQTAAGVTALAVAAAGGTWLLHRRARGDGA